MIGKINHIGIAVSSIDESLKLYAAVLGLSVQGVEVIAEQKTRTAILPVGESKLELLESTDPEGPVARFIQKYGEGLHHIALEVADLDAALKKVAEQGIPLIDEKPRKGVEGTRIAFLHPKGTGRVLLEMVQTI
jgi:methylmalonyl-CoA epimerase